MGLGVTVFGHVMTIIEEVLVVERLGIVLLGSAVWAFYARSSGRDPPGESGGGYEAGVCNIGPAEIFPSPSRGSHRADRDDRRRSAS